MKDSFIRLAQMILRDRVNPSLDVDGDFGKESIAAAEKFSPDFSGKRMTTEQWVATTIQRETNLKPRTFTSSWVTIEEDGWWGPDTQDAAYRLIGGEHVGWRPDEKSPIENEEPLKVKCWTPSDYQMVSQYGSPGSNQVQIALPFAMRLDWDLKSKVNKTTCHKLAASSITGALEEIRDAYGKAALTELGIDRFGGILNVRKKRGGTTWSAHAWGTAIDLYPSANQLSWKKDRAVFAKAEYNKLREAFNKAGWMSLGTCYNFDWMHWQLNP